MWIVPMVVFATSWVLTGGLRRYAVAHRMVDVPNSRSSHTVPTPRGGGGAIVLSAIGGFAWFLWSDVANALPLGVLVSGAVVALVGFIDDHRPLPAPARLTVHLAAAVMVVLSLERDRALGWFGLPFGTGYWGDLLGVLFIVWLLNLTNFMDGIDGIAGVEVVSVSVAGAFLHAIALPAGVLWWPAVVLGAATAGFLPWNKSPARIFMGDVGSGYTGFMLGVLILRAASISPALGWGWMILFAVFVADATITLLRRMVARQSLFEAHRSHAYQHLALAWGSHQKVVSLVFVINVVWLTPIAALVSTHRLDATAGIVLAYLPLSMGAAWLGAGVPTKI